jgi:hypothetical protein
MDNYILYVSHVYVLRDHGFLRRAWLPAEDKPVIFGVHSEIAANYKVDPAKVKPHAVTLDHVVAAATG